MAKMRSGLAVLSEALETAASCALIAVGLYALVFVDLTGGGSLWNSLGRLRAAPTEAASAAR